MSESSHAPMFVREMGLSARFVIYLLASLFLAALDARYDALGHLRAAFNAALHPAQKVVAWPFEFLSDAGGFFVVHAELQRENARLVEQGRRLQAQLQDYQAVQAENLRLRALLELPPMPGLRRSPAEIIQASPNPFSRKVTLNRGAVHGITTGSPVIDENGLLGQVTAVFPWSAELTQLTDRNQAAPVQSLRSGLRVLVSGMGSDSLLEVRYLDQHADLQAGDILVTSGIDGVYPAGVPVARVLRIEPPRNSPFARAVCQSLGAVGRHRQVLVLQPDPKGPAIAVTPADAVAPATIPPAPAQNAAEARP